MAPSPSDAALEDEIHVNVQDKELIQILLNRKMLKSSVIFNALTLL